MIVALNNKSNLEKVKYEEYLTELNKIESNSLMILCPTLLNLGNTNNSKWPLGAQNVSTQKDGAYTGEVSAEQLKSYNVKYCIIGHSERREYQKESLDEIRAKVNQLLEANITPIFCVGETKKQRENNEVKKVIEEEILTAITDLNDCEKEKIIIAYEPIWSIGTGVIPTKDEITEVFNFIKKLLPNTKILYGGSANENNVDSLKEISLIDGYLLGGLSLKTKELKVFLEKLEN